MAKKIKVKRKLKKLVRQKSLHNFTLVYLIVPIIFILFVSFWFLKKPPVKLVTSPQFSYIDNKLENNPPQRIVIPSLNIDLPVRQAPIIDGFWETSTDSASFGLGSAYPGKAGNTVVFAHALQNLFGNLGFIQPDANIYLLTANKWFNYKVKSLKTVLPTEIEVIAPTSDKTLTLYTCAGYGDVYRFVVIAKAL